PSQRSSSKRWAGAKRVLCERRCTHTLAHRRCSVRPYIHTLQIHKLLIGLRKLNPQFALNGLGKKCSNLWVAKPAAKSRGQGIRTFRMLDELLQYIGLSDLSACTPSQWIVQKYIENPLIIANRKFDLRQWVLVTSWNPLTVY